jgi:hypothetical protein
MNNSAYRGKPAVKTRKKFLESFFLLRWMDGKDTPHTGFLHLHPRLKDV